MVVTKEVGRGEEIKKEQWESKDSSGRISLQSHPFSHAE